MSVQYAPPPISLLAQATAMVTAMGVRLPPGKNNAVIGVATDVGWNAALVHRHGERVTVVGWVASNWGAKLTGGVKVEATW